MKKPCGRGNGVRLLETGGVANQGRDEGRWREMKYTIKHKITGKTLFECDADSLALAIGQAIG